MASRTVKFEISVEKLQVKFEGDVQMAERISAEVTDALSALGSTHNRVLNPAPPTPSTVVPASATARRRQRRKKRPETIDPSIVETPIVSEENASPNGASSRRGRPSGKLTEVLLELKEEGFFKTRRKLKDIHGAVSAKGHGYPSATISGLLPVLTRQGELKRAKDSANQWNYFTD